MSKRRKFDSFQKDQASINNDVETITSKDTGTVKKKKINLEQLRITYEKAKEAVCSGFIPGIKLTNILEPQIVLNQEYVVSWEEVVQCANTPIVKYNLKKATIICASDYRNEIEDYVDTLTITQKRAHIDNVRTTYTQIRADSGIIDKQINKFMKGEIIISAHKDKVTKFFENQSKLITFSKKTQKESQKKAKNLKKPNNIRMRNQQKKSRILYEKVVLKKKRSHIKKQYDVTDCKLTSVSKSLKKKKQGQEGEERFSKMNT